VPKAVAKDQRLKRLYFKLVRKKGKTKAKIAVARKMLISIYYMLKNREEYKFFRGELKLKRRNTYYLKPVTIAGKS